MTIVPSIAIYKKKGGLEWANRYYFPVTAEPADANANALMGAERLITSDEVSFTRYEVFSSSGLKIAEGTLEANVGLRTGEMLPVHYCALIRLVSPLIGRPSTKYIHGLTETSHNNGVVDSSFLTAVASYSAALVTLGVADSDGQPITGAVFRSFSRRKRMRREAA